MISKLGGAGPLSDRAERSGSRTTAGSARIHIFPEARDGAEGERERAVLLARLKERVRSGAYLPDVRQLALSLIMDDRLPLVEE